MTQGERPDEADLAECWLVQFDDGVTDFWVKEDPAARYEFKAAGPGGE